MGDDDASSHSSNYDSLGSSRERLFPDDYNGHRRRFSQPINNELAAKNLNQINSHTSSNMNGINSQIPNNSPPFNISSYPSRMYNPSVMTSAISHSITSPSFVPPSITTSYNNPIVQNTYPAAYNPQQIMYPVITNPSYHVPTQQVYAPAFIAPHNQPQVHANSHQQFYYVGSGPTPPRSLHVPKGDIPYQHCNEFVAHSNFIANANVQCSSQNAEPGKIFDDSIKLSPRDVADLLSDFDPSDRDCVSVQRWVDMCENIQRIYNISDFIMLYASVRKLKGNANLWYQSVSGSVGNWYEFRKEIVREFDPIRDVSDVHSILRDKKKKSNESYVNYIYNMRRIASEINLDDRTIIKYVISGISDEHVRSALAFQNILSLSDLLIRVKVYENIVSSSCNKSDSHKYDKNIKRDHNSQSPSSSTSNQSDKSTRRCYKCNSPDHMAPNCKKLICSYCRKEGHYEIACPTKAVDKSSSSTASKDVHRVESTDSEYVKIVNVNGQPVRAFIDLGSDCVTLKKSVATQLKLNWFPHIEMLRGFGNNMSSTLGISEVNLEIDGINFIMLMF